jgi:Flp pilus assembly protein TadG
MVPTPSVPSSLPAVLHARRSGAVAVELAVMLPLVLVLLFGVWDVGRILETQQLLSNAAREGAREASVGVLLDSTTGYQKDVTAADVQQTVLNYLKRNGVATNGVMVQYDNLDNPGALDPYQASNLQHLRVTVQLPFKNVRLILTNNFMATNYKVLTGASDWFSTKDTNINVATTIPTN